jgi:hypothetical protein
MGIDHRKRGKEALPLNNMFVIMVILFVAMSVFSSYLTYKRSMAITQELTGASTEAMAKLCINRAPTIIQNCSTNATIGTGYYCDVDATDPENDTITFYDDTSIFDIVPGTGEIIFTPVSGQEGTHNIALTASDGKGCANSNSTTLLVITITSQAVTPPAGGGGGGGGGGGEGVSAKCSPQWECTPWSSCGPNGKVFRQCYTLNNCPFDKPSEEEECIYVLPPMPRKKIKYPAGHYLCNFDIVDECTESFGVNENWVYTYLHENSTLKVIGISDGADVTIDENILFNVQIARIKGVDATSDGINDFEYILHTAGERAYMTIRLIHKIEKVIERPVFVAALPWPLPQILMFTYEHACYVLLILMIIAAMLIYGIILGRMDDNE